MTPGTRRAWSARLALLLTAVAAVWLVVAAATHGLWVFLLVAAVLVLVVSAAYWFLADRGWRRTAALVVLLGVPVAAIVRLVMAAFLFPLLVAVGLLVLAAGAGREALAPRAARSGCPST